MGRILYEGAKSIVSYTVQLCDAVYTSQRDPQLISVAMQFIANRRDRAKTMDAIYIFQNKAKTTIYHVVLVANLDTNNHLALMNEAVCAS